MPDPYRPGEMDFRRTYTLATAAAEHRLIICQCGLCRRRAIFLASDLVQVLPPNRDALLPPFPCSKCGRSDYVWVKAYSPDREEYGVLTIRRLVGIRPVAYWRDGVLE